MYYWSLSYIDGFNIPPLYWIDECPNSVDTLSLSISNIYQYMMVHTCLLDESMTTSTPISINIFK